MVFRRRRRVRRDFGRRIFGTYASSWKNAELPQ
jgi:hypothetical protein